MPRRSRGVITYLVILLAIMAALAAMYNFQPTSETHGYYEILSYYQNHQIREFSLDLNTSELRITRLVTGDEEKVEALRGDIGSLQKALEEYAQFPVARKLSQNLAQVQEADPWRLKTPVVYKVPYLVHFIDDITPYVLEYNEANPDAIIDGTYLPTQEMPWWVQLLPTLLLVGLMVAFWVMMMRQSRGGGNVSGFGKAKARSAQEGRRVTFDDVAGADEEKEELIEIVEFLRSPGKYNALGARIPKGVILMGPPGTGKTLLARAVAGEADVQFFSISGSDFVEMFVGVGASRVRDLFDQAKKNAPSVIFIDEIDAVGRQRGAGLGGGHDEREQTLNQLLVEMDGFSANTGVIVMAATNRRDILDPALMRPGRFDRQITVNYPDIKGREEILKVHSRNKPIAPDVNLKTIAGTTAGFTGADLENLLNEAALLAARKNLKAITMDEVAEASIKVVAGPEKRSHVYTEKDKNLTAYHEAGHAICSYYCPTQDPVHQVSVIPRGPMGGFTMTLPSEDRKYVAKTFMIESIIVLMGGRVAEQLVLEDISTGASNDLERASKMARNMVTRYGFSSKLGPVVYSQDSAQVFLGRDYTSGNTVSENVASEIDAEVRTIIDDAYRKSTEILTEHMDQLHFIAQHLFKNEKVEGEEFAKMMKMSPEEAAARLREEEKDEASAKKEEEIPNILKLDILIGEDEKEVDEEEE